MYPGYRNLINLIGLKSLLKAPVVPDPALAIGGDDEMSDIPLLIFRDQHLPQPVPMVSGIQSMPYEKTAVKGAGDTLDMADFVTDDFNLGADYASIL